MLYQSLIFLFFLLILSNDSFAQKGVIFDDFSYTNNQFPIDGDSSGSIFGKNIWKTKNGYISTRAWHRYNRDEHKFNDYADVVAEDSVVKLIFRKGYTSNLTNPIFVSGFLLSHGTYTSRVKFSTLQQEHLIQAFWLTSPHYYIFNRAGENILNWDEMDFEWNNFFVSGDKYLQNMTVGCNNNNAKYIKNTTYDYFYKTENDFQILWKGTTASGGKELFDAKWYICIFVLDSLANNVSFYMYSDDETIDGNVSAVSTKDEKFVEGFTIDNYFPKMPLNVVYSMHASEISQDMYFYSDWFYYSEKTDLNKDEILEEVRKLKSQGINRLNTTNIETFSECLDTSPGALRIAGPKSVKRCENAKWTIASDYKFWAPYELNFRYRINNDSIIGEWIEVYDRNIYMQVPDFATGIEIEMYVFEYWRNYHDTVKFAVNVENGDCGIEQSKYYNAVAYGNPARSSVQLMMDIYKSDNFQITLHDFLGNKIKDICNSELNIGRHDFDISLNQYSQSIYLLVIISNSKTESLKIIKAY
jgi:hypothetical protein